jgi:hypothetical protein
VFSYVNMVTAIHSEVCSLKHRFAGFGTYLNRAPQCAWSPTGGCHLVLALNQRGAAGLPATIGAGAINFS